MSLPIDKSHRSPNHDARGEPVDMIVLHYTGMETGQAALERLCDPSAKVSAHYLVEEDGTVFGLVDEGQRAWHAGVSHWQGRDNVNGCSVGIEIVNQGHFWGYRPFTAAQTVAVIELVREIHSRHAVPLSRVVGHSDVAPARKEDPGELFPWDMLAGEKLALGTATGEGQAPGYEACLQALGEIGYGLGADGGHGAAVLAFQRRFLPHALGQGLDPATRAAIAEIREKAAAAG